MRRRWIAALGAAAVLAALVLAATTLHPGLSNLDTIAKQGDAKQGLIALERSGIGAGALEPAEALVHGSSPEQVASALVSMRGVHGAVAPNSPQWRHGTTAVVDGFPTADGLTLRGCYLSGRGEARRGVILFGLEFGSNRWSAGPKSELPSW